MAGSRVAALRTAVADFVGDHRPVLPTALAELEAAAQTVFRHLELSYQLVPQRQCPGWPDPDLTDVRRVGADIAVVQRGHDGSGMIRLTGLAPVQAAAPLLAGAFTLCCRTMDRYSVSVMSRAISRRWREGTARASRPHQQDPAPVVAAAGSRGRVLGAPTVRIRGGLVGRSQERNRSATGPHTGSVLQARGPTVPPELCGSASGSSST